MQDGKGELEWDPKWLSHIVAVHDHCLKVH